MSWLMYATRSTMRTIFPSSVAGLDLAGVRQDPSQTSWVRFSARARSGSDCSWWRKPAAPNRSPQRLVERVLAGVAERRMTHVVPEPDRLGQVLVQPERPGDDARDRRRLERVGHPRAVVVALRVDEDLRLPLQPAERLRVDDPVAVALERRPHAALLLFALAAARLVGAHGERRQPRLLVLADAGLEGVSNSPGQLGHRFQPSRCGGAFQSRRPIRPVTPTRVGSLPAALGGRRYRRERVRVSVTVFAPMSEPSLAVRAKLR